jgi:hypothetical protein
MLTKVDKASNLQFILDSVIAPECSSEPQYKISPPGIVTSPVEGLVVPLAKTNFKLVNCEQV